MIFRPAEQGEFEAVMAIIEDGRAALKALGLDQWQGGSPNAAMIEADLAAGRTHVAVDEDGAVLGTAACIETGEPDYDNVLEGDWLSSGAPYLTLHRIAVAKSAARRGVASFMINTAAEQARERGLKSLRADTHEGNIPMQRTFEKCGMERCCVIRLSSELEPTRIRLGFERIF